VKFFLAILVIVALALVSVSERFYRVRRSKTVAWIISGNWLHVGVGVLLGPQVIGAIEEDKLQSLTPMLAIGLGWIGVTIGLQARFDLLRGLPRSFYASAATDIAASLAVFGAIAWFILSYWAPDAPAAAIWPGTVLISTASIGWLLETRSLRPDSSPESGRLALCVRGAGALCAIAAVLAFGLFAHASARGADGEITFAWNDAGLKALITALLAITAGVIGRFAIRLAGGDRSELLVVFLGLVAMVAGAATSLGYSPMLASALAGIVIANLAGAALRRFERFIIQAEHVVAALFAILAGMLMDIHIGLVGAVMAAVIAAARWIIKAPVFRFGARSGRTADNVDYVSRGELPQESPLYYAPIRQAPMAIALGVALVITEASSFSKQLLCVVALTGVLSSAPLAYVAVRAGRAKEDETREQRPAAEPESEEAP